MTVAVLPAIESAIAEGVVMGTQAQLVRDVVGLRMHHLNRTLG